MSQFILLENIVQELRAQSIPPLAVHIDGVTTYVVYGLRNVGNLTGYPVLRVTEPSSTQIYLDTSFLLESDRLGGTNGSTPGANIKVDAADAILLLTNPALIYG
jgi:hypothetical protein